MTHSITLEIPDSDYQTLAGEAEESGQRIEDFALGKLTSGNGKITSDPLDKFVGAFRSDVPDWTINHDKYIGENLIRELRGENE